MGLYDDVDYKIECPKCGEIIKCFQTKDCGRTMGKDIDIIPMEEIKNDYNQKNIS